MHINKLFILAMITLFVIPHFLTAQISVSKIDDSFNAGNKDGIVYALPRTLIQVDVTVEQKELLAGPLRNYAEKYLGITNYISQNAFEYSIKGIKLIPVSEPDPEQYYFVSEVEKTSKETWQTILTLNGHGMITSVGAINDGQAGVASGLGNPMSDDEVMAIFSKYADLNLYAKVDTIVRIINIDTITIEDYTFKTTMTNKPLEVKAREVADMIHRVREGRYNLLTGYQEVNYSEGALKFMNEELLKMEEEYLCLFTGAVVKSNLTYSFTFLPTPENSGSSVPIFHFSESNGIVEGGGGGVQAMILVESHGNTSVLASGEANSGGGLVYRIPEEAEVKLIYNSNTLAKIHAAISQFGRVASLPADVSNVEFDGETGGLRSIQLDAE